MTEITNADEARAAIAQARAEFRELVQGLSDAEWGRKSHNSGWTNGQLCWHIAFTAGGGGMRVSRLRQGKGFDPPGPLMAVLHLLSEWIVRIRSRGATPATVLALFDETCTRTETAIDTVADDEWGNSGVFLGETISVGDAFGFIGGHVAEHAAEMRRG
ncbi:MAG: DinB family protein [Chloroflexota bacterium]|nr:DinB family protein [Chloroflexota bacterium]MDE2894515.1 DinB family protein [Chloroflexota bacterium]